MSKLDFAIAPTQTNSLVLIDGHVHVYDCYARAGLFDQIFENFETHAKTQGATRFDSVLLLTESAGHQFFASLENGGDDLPMHGFAHWKILTTDEACSVQLVNERGQKLFVIAGRQVETKERIEISALFTKDNFSDGHDLESSIREIREQGAVAVLPWGVGKWIGHRGKLVSRLIEKDEGLLYLSDNGSRPFLWPSPPQFRALEHGSGVVLAGTDPLPFPSDAKRIGTFGFCIPGHIDQDQPARWIRNQLQEPGFRPVRFGNLQGLGHFITNRRAMKAHRSAEARSPDRTETPDIETSSEGYAARFSGPVGQYMLEVQAESIETVLGNARSGSVLDVGGGHGQLAGQLLDRGFTVTVFGSDPACRARLAPFESHPRFSFLSGNLFDLPFGDRAFDYVIAVRLISHIENRQRLYAELCRVAKQSVIVDYPSWYSLNVLTPIFFGLKKFIEKNTRTYHTFSGNRLAAQFSVCGFKLGQRSAQFFLPMFLHRGLGVSKLLRGIERVANTLGLTALLGSPVILRVDRTDNS